MTINVIFMTDIAHGDKLLTFKVIHINQIESRSSSNMYFNRDNYS